jgi:hypothetical protein
LFFEEEKIFNFGYGIGYWHTRSGVPRGFTTLCFRVGLVLSLELDYTPVATETQDTDFG